MIVGGAITPLLIKLDVLEEGSSGNSSLSFSAQRGQKIKAVIDFFAYYETNYLYPFFVNDDSMQAESLDTIEEH